MAHFKIDIEKSIDATLLVLRELDGTADFHKVFKILYFADQKHLAKFGRPITGDDYVAMNMFPGNYQKAHDEAYNNSFKDEFISLFDIARAGGTNDAILQ